MDAFITRRGGAGGGLNFKVLGGTTRPTNPKENTIWVNTPNEITGWALSPFDPENPIDGMVWVELVSENKSTPFNALSKNVQGIWVYPDSSKQYIGGEWIVFETKIYQNNDWVDLAFWLLDGDDQYTENSGGWQINFGGISSAGIRCTPNPNAATNPKNLLMTNQQIDFTPYNTLAVHIVENKLNDWFGIGVGSSTSRISSSAAPPYAERWDRNRSTGWYTLPIDTVDRAGYVMMGGDGSSGTYTLVDKVYLKK